MRKERSNERFAEWIKEKARNIVEYSKMLEVSDVHYPGHSWSVVKLLLLGGWVYVYTTIIPRHFPKYQYVDLLAGSGTTLVKETKDVVAGSPFVAHAFARNEFMRYIFLEKDHTRCEALRQRAAQILGVKTQVLEGDCNKLVKSVAPSEGNTHSLVFVDNEGFDTIWSTTETLLAARADLLILFPTSCVPRVAESERTQGSLDRYYGSKNWPKNLDVNDFLRAYTQLLEKGFRKFRNCEPYVSSVRVGNEQFFYDIILVCREGPYKRAWEYLKTKLDWQDPKIVERTLDVLKGRATQIDWFFKELDNQVTYVEPSAQPSKTTKMTDFL